MVQHRRFDAVRSLFYKALEHGAHLASPTRVEWDLGAICSDPYSIEIAGRGDLLNYRSVVNPGFVMVAMSGLPCRRCPDCLRIKAARWAERAVIEHARSTRSWFCTFTLEPKVQHWVFMNEMARKTSKGWLDSDFNDEAKEFLLRCHGGLRLMTKFWKNVRKTRSEEEPVLLKYLLVAERHVSGLPHYHALVHEQAGHLTYRRMSTRWLKHGFFHAKLVGMDDLSPEQSARYVTKYIGKDMLARVRASQRYGLHQSPENVLDALREGDAFRQKALSLTDVVEIILEKSERNG